MSAPSIQTVKPLSTDEQLIQMIGTGDSAAFGELYDLYVCPCFGLASRLLGDDARAEAVVHAVFADLWNHSATYSPLDGRFPGWLLNTIHHRCITELRQMHEAQATVVRAAPHANVITTVAALDSHAASDVGSVTVLEQQKVISEALGQLAPDQREILELAYFGGLSHTQIAEKLSQPVSAIHGHARTGLRHLNALLEPSQLLV